MENLPSDVVWAMAIDMGPRHVDAETYKKYREIVLKYPDYFYRDYQYFSATDEQHEEYKKGELLLEEKFKDNDFPEFKGIPGEGIVAYLERKEEWLKTQPKKSLSEIMEIYGKRQERKFWKNLILVDITKPFS